MHIQGCGAVVDAVAVCRTCQDETCSLHLQQLCLYLYLHFPCIAVYIETAIAYGDVR